MVEVALAVGVAAFALLAILALLPLGLKSNQVSVEETRAATILTALEADLRNTHPSLNSGKSAIFGLDLPYEADALGKYSFNSKVIPATLTDGVNTTGLNAAEDPVPSGGTERHHFQASVIYQPLVPATPFLSRQARLVVCWPSVVGTTDPSSLTDSGKVSGYLESVVSFPAP